jgi:hypothetical protein
VLALFDWCKLAVSNSINLIGNHQLSGKYGVSTHSGTRAADHRQAVIGPTADRHNS